MADRILVKRLLDGTAQWNAWRQETADAVIDLSDADLSGAALAGADLRGADLNGADLTGADLTGACLIEADMFGVKAKGACFRDAALAAADAMASDFCGCDFTGAALAGADFRRAKLIATDFAGADLSGANMEAAELDDVNLTGALMLDAIFDRGAAIDRAGGCDHGSGPITVKFRPRKTAVAPPEDRSTGVIAFKRPVDAAKHPTAAALKGPQADDASALAKQRVRLLEAVLDREDIKAWVAGTTSPITPVCLESLRRQLVAFDRMLADPLHDRQALRHLLRIGNWIASLECLIRSMPTQEKTSECQTAVRDLSMSLKSVALSILHIAEAAMPATAKHPMKQAGTG